MHSFVSRLNTLLTFFACVAAGLAFLTAVTGTHARGDDATSCSTQPSQTCRTLVKGGRSEGRLPEARDLLVLSHYCLAIADFLHNPNPAVDVSLDQVKKLVTFQGRQDQVRRSARPRGAPSAQAPQARWGSPHVDEVVACRQS